MYIYQLGGIPCNCETVPALLGPAEAIAEFAGTPEEAAAAKIGRAPDTVLWEAF